MTRLRSAVLAALLLAVPAVELLAQSSALPQGGMASQSLRDVEDRLGQG